MNNIYQHYIIDLSSNNNFVQIPTVQGDGNNIRGFEVELIENGVQYEIDKNDCLVAIMGTKPDTSQIMNDCTVSDEGYILVDITSQMSAVKGRGDYQIVLMSRSTNSQLKSFPFHILTTPAAFDIDHIVSSDEFQALTRNIVRTEEVIEDANDAISDMRALESSVSAAESNRISNENTRIQNEIDREQAEKNRIDAENQRIAAENIRIGSEQNRDDAENIRIANEETRETNETVRNNNETNRINSETDRINAEADRASAEEDRITSENTRKSNEDIRKTNEEARITAESIRNEEEIARTDAENIRVANENVRISNENSRIQNEIDREQAETIRINAETDRGNAEDVRETNENIRIENENARKTEETKRDDAENIRIDNESVRQTNETIRETNESNRQTNTATAISNAEKATDNANAAAEKARVAGEKATAAETTAIEKAAEADNYAKLSQSYAVGTGDVRPDESTDNAKYYSEQSKSYADSWKGSLLPKGTIPFSQLPTADNVAGHMYNISDAFETDPRFKDGAGYAYPAGTNVYWTADEKWDCLSGAITMELTMAEYNALSDAQKMNGTIYYISDADNSIPSATENFDGLMSHADKQKLDGIEDGANAYSLPLASESVCGGVKVGYTQNGNNYPVQLNDDEQMYVNINLQPEDIGAAKNSGYDCYGECTTDANVNAKAVTVNGNFALRIGVRVFIKFTQGDAGSSYDYTSNTLNVNGSGAYPIRYALDEHSGFGANLRIRAGEIYEFIFNNGAWIFMDKIRESVYYNPITHGPVLTMWKIDTSSGSEHTDIVFSGCTNAIYAHRGSSTRPDNGGTTYAYDDNPETTLGRSDAPWNGIYLTKSPIVTSDRNAKKEISNMSGTYMNLFDSISIQRYVLCGGNDTLTTTKNQRYHLGVVAQDVEKVVRSCGMTSDDFGGVCSEYFACYGSFKASIHGGWREKKDERDYSDNVYNWKHRNDTGVEPYEIYNEIMEEQIANLHIDSYRKNIGYIMIEDNSKLTKEQPSVTINSVSLVDYEGNITPIRFTDFLRYYTTDDTNFENPLSDVVMHENGSATISFNRMYGCAWLKLSEVIDISKYSSVIIDVDYIGEYTVVFIPDGEYQNANPYDRDRNDQILYNYSFRYDELFALTAYALQETRKEFSNYKAQTDETIRNLTYKIDCLTEKVENKYEYDGN